MATALPIELQLRWDSNPQPVAWIVMIAECILKLTTSGGPYRNKTKGNCMERVARIELANKPWQGFRLPLHHTRIYLLYIL